MSANSNDDLSKALALQKQAARSTQPAARNSHRGGPDIGELFLEELRMRRARLREWIDMLNREADDLQLQPAAARLPRMAPQSCRSRRNRRVEA